MRIRPRCRRPECEGTFVEYHGEVVFAVAGPDVGILTGTVPIDVVGMRPARDGRSPIGMEGDGRREHQFQGVAQALTWILRLERVSNLTDAVRPIR